MATNAQELVTNGTWSAGSTHASRRVKDVCFDDGQIVVRSGKGDKDRITVLPDLAREMLKAQVDVVRHQHAIDLEEGPGAVFLPNALGRKYPAACRELAW